MYGNSFYNPYMYSNYINTATKTGLFSGLFKKFNFTNFLTGASKTLNVVNQAIPIYYQVKPMINNAKTMFRIMNAVKTPDKNNIKEQNSKVNETVTKENDGNPTFFI